MKAVVPLEKGKKKENEKEIGGRGRIGHGHCASLFLKKFGLILLKFKSLFSPFIGPLHVSCLPKMS